VIGRSSFAVWFSRTSIESSETAIAELEKGFFSVAVLALIGSGFVGLPQSARAQEHLTVAAINSTLRDLPAAEPGQTGQRSDDAALSALSAFVRRIAVDEVPAAGKASQAPNGQFDDQDYAALQDFARRIGTARPELIEYRPKLADADNAIDALKEFLNKGSSSAPAAVPKAPVSAPHRTSAPVEATYVGAKVCMTCHATQAESFSHTLMGRIGKTQKGKFDCENCHGPGSAHVKAGGGRGVGGIISFRPEDQSRTAEENNAICLSCHERGDRTNWQGSTHETRGLMCTNCHTVMKAESRKNQLKTAFEPDTCFQCHKDRRAQMFRSSHMPLREGKIVCSDCHNPHGSFTEALLKKDSINDTCYTCHAEKRGPFLFEHLPVRENCDNCHDPHGSVNEFSLKMSRPRLCFECHQAGHGQNAGVFGGTTMGRSCQNCHTQIHGSNAPAGGALQR
jgi:DmsE family decaheme c-type cytochrome